MADRSVAAPERSGRGRSQGGRNAGQAIVEFAVITPVFFLVFFGIIEFALLTASIGSFNFATREGAVAGSILGRTSPNVDQSIVTAISNRVQGIVMAKGLEVDIYKADSNNGSCLTSSGTDTTVGSANCLEDQYQINGQPLPGGTMTWPPANRNDTLQNADYLGVRVVYQYTYLTGFLAAQGSALGLTAYSVQRIEPQDYFGWHGRRPTQPVLAALAESQRLGMRLGLASMADL